MNKQNASNEDDGEIDFEKQAKEPVNPNGATPWQRGGKTTLGMKSIAIRHKKKQTDHIHGITKPAIRRLARRAGVKRISGLMYDEMRSVIKRFLEAVIRDAIVYTRHARRKTVTCQDIIHGLRRKSGKTLYGFV